MKAARRAEMDKDFAKGFEAAMTEHHDKTLATYSDIFAAGALWAVRSLKPDPPERKDDQKSSH